MCVVGHDDEAVELEAAFVAMMEKRGDEGFCVGCALEVAMSLLRSEADPGQTRGKWKREQNDDRAQQPNAIFSGTGTPFRDLTPESYAGASTIFVRQGRFVPIIVMPARLPEQSKSDTCKTEIPRKGSWRLVRNPSVTRLNENEFTVADPGALRSPNP
jgi:hypothetical protein